MTAALASRSPLAGWWNRQRALARNHFNVRPLGRQLILAATEPDRPARPKAPQTTSHQASSQQASSASSQPAQPKPATRQDQTGRQSQTLRQVVAARIAAVRRMAFRLLDRDVSDARLTGGQLALLCGATFFAIFAGGLALITLAG